MASNFQYWSKFYAYFDWILIVPDQNESSRPANVVFYEPRGVPARYSDTKVKIRVSKDIRYESK